MPGEIDQINEEKQKVERKVFKLLEDFKESTGVEIIGIVVKTDPAGLIYPICVIATIENLFGTGVCHE
jgi:hypothetical protein